MSDQHETPGEEPTEEVGARRAEPAPAPEGEPEDAAPRPWPTGAYDAGTTEAARTPPPPRKLFRSRQDRVIGGVAGGLGRYFHVDPIIFRIAAVALAFAGGAGILVYLAALLFVPSEGGPGQPSRGPSTLLTVVGAIVLGLAALALVDGLGGWVGPIGPLALLAVGGVALWLLVRGDHDPGSPRQVLARIGLVLAVGAALIGAAIASAWATAEGFGAIVAGLVVALGALLVVGAVRRQRRARWLILPALAVALPLGFVAAADIRLEGGYGGREYRPTSPAELQPRYELAAGDLVVDLRDVKLPPGERRLDLGLGMGAVTVVVPDDVCVTTAAQVGMGSMESTSRADAGFDLDRRDRPVVPASVPHLDVTARVGLGELQVMNATEADPLREPERFAVQMSSGERRRDPVGLDAGDRERGLDRAPSVDVEPRTPVTDPCLSAAERTGA